MKNKWKLVFAFSLFLILSATSLSGHALVPSDTLILTDSREEYSLFPYLEILADPDQILTFSEISSPEYRNNFQPSSGYDFSVESSTYWFRLDLSNKAKVSTAWLLLYDSYRLNYISIYSPEPYTGGYREVHTGNALPFSSRDYDYHYFVFRLDLPVNEQQTLYLYVSDVGGVSLDPFKIQSLSSFSQHAINEQFWSGAYYFSIFIIALYTFFSFFPSMTEVFSVFSFCFSLFCCHRSLLMDSVTSFSGRI